MEPPDMDPVLANAWNSFVHEFRESTNEPTSEENVRKNVQTEIPNTSTNNDLHSKILDNNFR